MPISRASSTNAFSKPKQRPATRRFFVPADRRERKGICLVYSTDTRPCETLSRYAAGADLLILEGMYGSEDKRKQALKNHHMMFSEAAEIAAGADAGPLLLTHFSTSVEDPETELPEARQIYEKTYAAHDGETVTLRYPKEDEKAWVSLC